MRPLPVALRRIALPAVCGLVSAWPAPAAATPARFEVASIRMIADKDVVRLPGNTPFSPPGAGQFTMREGTLALAIAWAFDIGGGGAHAYIFLGGIDLKNQPADSLAAILAHVLGKPVVDQTGLKGSYDVRLEYAPMDGANSDAPSIYTAVEEQLGLRLEAQSLPVEAFVIDHIDRVPTEN